jgi:predicted CoA-binding protein
MHYHQDSCTPARLWRDLATDRRAENNGNMSQPTVAILGASRDRRKIGNKSVRAHLQQGYHVFPVNPHATEIEGLPAYPDLASVPVERLDRISVYLPPEVALELLPEIQARGAKEVWFNPGSDSDDVIARAEALGLEIIRACSIVDVGVSPAAL